MKTLLYMATTLNGCIARENGETDFVSEAEWEEGYSKAAEETGNIIVGRRTYESMIAEDEFSMLPEAIEVVVVSRSGASNLLPGHMHAASPQKAVEMLERKGFDTALVAGGSELNGAFLKEGMIDGVVIDMESVIIGRGKNLCVSDFATVRLAFRDMKEIAPNLLQLRYDVLKETSGE